VLLNEISIAREATSAETMARRRAAATETLEHVGIAVAVFAGAKHELQLVNASWRDLFGEDALKKKYGGLHDRATARFAEVMRTQFPLHLADLELTAKHRVGFYEVSISARMGGDGKPDGVLVTCMDTTEEVLERVLSVPPDALMWSGLPSGELQDTNRAWRAYVGPTPKKSWLRQVHPSGRDRCIAAFHEAMEKGRVASCEVRLRRSDGAYRWYELRFINADNERGFVAAMQIPGADLVRSERAARKEAELANRLKDRFLAAVSHELRAPLTTMMLWEGVLRSETSDDAIRARALDAIHQSALMQSRLVGDLLDVSRANSGKLYVDTRPIDIARVIEQAVAEITPALMKKNLSIEIKLGNSSVVDGDPVRLRQVIDNLLSNALKFTEPGGKLGVLTERRDNMVAIVISDTGRGIAKNYLRRIFEPFSQLDESMTRSDGGLGLGLAIARELVLLHSGTIEAASPGPGMGATFTILLPLGKKRRMTTPPPTERPASLDRLRILVIDDDHRLRSALALLLGRSGADVTVATSAQHAREQLEKSGFDALICDIAMPHEDGYSLIRSIRATGSDTPAIALTAHATPADAGLALSAGFDVHVAKPVDINHLVGCINQAIETRSTRVRK
jgi:signal transduction histidine kinase/ActR/RegA family two-component response regulator